MPDPYIIAIDFDGCIAYNAWPNIENALPIRETFEKIRLQLLTNPNTIFVLWTCREDSFLEDAKEFILQHALPIYYFNENPPVVLSLFYKEAGCRKIYADEYWDDKAVFCGRKESYK